MHLFISSTSVNQCSNLPKRKWRKSNVGALKTARTVNNFEIQYEWRSSTSCCLLWENFLCMCIVSSKERVVLVRLKLFVLVEQDLSPYILYLKTSSTKSGYSNTRWGTQPGFDHVRCLWDKDTWHFNPPSNMDSTYSTEGQLQYDGLGDCFRGQLDSFHDCYCAECYCCFHVKPMIRLCYVECWNFPPLESRIRITFVHRACLNVRHIPPSSSEIHQWILHGYWTVMILASWLSWPWHQR